MPAGDKNTRFFHERASQRWRKNHISRIFDKDGTWRTSKDHIAQTAEQYFQELFCTANPMGMESVLDSVTRAILSVLHSGHFLRKMNYTHIVLIPKSNNPTHVSDYKPISLGNFISRILSKVIANRLKLVLPIVISEAQSAFVPNWLITNNTSVAYELLHRMRNRRQGKVGHMAVKLDISKTYDWVEWSFLRNIMLKIV